MANLRLHRWLPPLLIAGGLGFLLYTVFRPNTEARDRDIAALRARVASPSARAGVKSDVDALLDKYGTDPVARWAAIEVHARRLDLRGALAAYDGDPALRNAPGSPRRFARELLRWLGDRSPDGPPATWLYPRSLLARLDLGDADAKSDLEEMTDGMDAKDLVNLYGCAHRSRTRGSATMSASWARRAHVPAFLGVSEVLHALPGETRVGERLRPLLESEWRTMRPFFWQHVARALGTVGDAPSMEALRRERERALGSSPDEETRRLVLDVALAL